MSRNYLGDLKEQPQPSGPHRALYAVPPAGMILNHDDRIFPTTASFDSQPHNKVIASATHSNSIVESKTKIYTAIIPPSHRVIQNASGASLAFPTGSNLPASTPSNHNYKMSPPLVNNGNGNSSYKKTDKAINRESSDELPWLAPLLGVLGTLGLVGIIILYLIGRKKKKRNNGTDNARVNQFINNNNSSGPQLSNSYQSWASLSTINMSAAIGEKKVYEQQQQQRQGHVPPPPAYTSAKQKRLTADTLVDENSISLMLKNQYSPQLAFSPSLVAGDFQQQQLEEVEKPPMPLISPSNTLIDNAGIINTCSPKTENYHYSFDHRPKKIEIYEPQVNLHNDSNPFIPYSYSNEQPEEQQSKNNSQHKANNENGNHHFIDMNK